VHKRSIAIAAGVAAIALLAAGCSSSKGSGSGSGSSSAAGGSTVASASGTPIRIAVMGILSGANAVKGYDNAFKMGVDEINASGGILGHPIEYKEFDTDITPQGAVNATNLAIDYKPSVIFGYGVSAGLKASVPAINAAGIPVIHGTLASLTSPDSLGSKLTFRLEPTTAQFAAAADKYLFTTQGVKSMVEINTQDSAPTEGATYIAADAKAAGVSLTQRAVSPTVTDLTEPVLAAKGKDAIWEWGYATTDALLVKTAAANGYTGQIMTFSAGAAARTGLLPVNLLSDKIHAVAACAPYASTDAAATKFDAAYKAKYSADPDDTTNAQLYDSLYLFKNAAIAAKSTDPAAIATQLSSVDYKGVCGEEKSDANHNLMHSVPILSFPGGKPTQVVLQDNLTSPF
jgi:branched-chain amino acid transport system substrate-binding protein